MKVLKDRETIMSLLTNSKAEIFAIAAHGNQQYGFHPYYKHLSDVARIVHKYCDHADDFDDAMTLAWLHDVLEDTQVKPEQIIQVFGQEIATYCQLLSDPPGLTRADRKIALNRVLSNPETPRCVLLVKAADRLANVRHSCLGNSTMIEKYRAEHPEFRKACFRAGLCDDLWHELDSRIAGTWKEF